MAAKRKALGKGLNELLSATFKEPEAVEPKKAKSEKNSKIEKNKKKVERELATGERLHEIPLEQLEAGPFQPREIMNEEALEQLSESIKNQGVIQPIVVREKTRDSYEIIAGERRFRAARLAGLEKIPAIIKSIDDDTALTVALIENIQRENLNAMEEARAIRRLSEELDLTHLELAEKLGKSRVSITNMLRLLSLNEDVQELLEEGKIDMGHAKALLALKGSKQSSMAFMISEKGLSVRETERLVSESSETKTKSKREGVELDPNIKRLETDLSDLLGTKVQVKHGSAGKGTVQINYSSLDELEGILELISA